MICQEDSEQLQRILTLPIDSLPNKIFKAIAREEMQKGIKSLLTLVGSQGARQVLRVISSPLNYGGTNGVEDFIPFDWFHAVYKGTDRCGGQRGFFDATCVYNSQFLTENHISR